MTLYGHIICKHWAPQARPSQERSPEFYFSFKKKKRTDVITSVCVLVLRIQSSALKEIEEPFAGEAKGRNDSRGG